MKTKREMPGECQFKFISRQAASNQRIEIIFNKNTTEEKQRWEREKLNSHPEKNALE